MAVAFSPDGSTLASASLDGTVKLWDVASGKELRTISGHTNAVSDVAFSQDGKYLATGSWDRTARIWDVTSGAEQMSFKTETSVNGVAFGHDGKRLAVASEDTVPHLYILEKGDLMQQARDRIRSIGRKLRPEECTKFLGMNTCPPTP
jgi:WD40 repeat protein